MRIKPNTGCWCFILRCLVTPAKLTLFQVINMPSHEADFASFTTPTKNVLFASVQLRSPSGRVRSWVRVSFPSIRTQVSDCVDTYCQA